MNKKNYYLDLLGLFSIGAISLGYIVFVRDLAERHIQFSFLNFPIFVGEMLFFVCLLLFLTKDRKDLPKLTKWHYLVASYVIFVIIKALYGYIKWGPLALRHAALLYYPVFAILSYAFYRRDFFSAKNCLVGFLAIFTVLLLKHSQCSPVTLMLLGIILIKSYPNKALKWFMFAALLVIIPYEELFRASRMMAVSNCLSGLYLATALPVILNSNKRLKFLLGMLMAGTVIVGLYKFADHNAVRSIVAFKKMAKVIRSSDEYIRANMDHFKMEERKGVKLYNPDKPVKEKSDPKVNIIQNKGVLQESRVKTESARFATIQHGQGKQAKEKVQRIIPQVKEQKMDSTHMELPEVLKPSEKPMATKVLQVVAVPAREEISSAQVKSLQEDAKEVVREIEREAEIEIRIEKVLFDQVEQKKQIIPLAGVVTHKEVANISTGDNESTQRVTREEIREKALPISLEKNNKKWADNDNAVFRILIWRDMLINLAKEKPIFGFDFGKPFRSKSLEILCWGDSEWKRDGWVEPHNSYLNIIYRAGIVGILFIFSFLLALFKMIRRFIQVKSLTGILLCGIIINWFVAANFLVIFELPYTAIPIWAIFGMTFAHCYKTREADADCEKKARHELVQ